jgi:hypothetical protein
MGLLLVAELLELQTQVEAVAVQALEVLTLAAMAAQA